MGNSTPLQDTPRRTHVEAPRDCLRIALKVVRGEITRDEAEKGAPHGLLDALRRLFQLKD